MKRENKECKTAAVGGFACEHPFITFLIADAVFAAVRDIVGKICNAYSYSKYADTFPYNNGIELPNWMKKETNNETKDGEAIEDEAEDEDDVVIDGLDDLDDTDDE